MARHRETLAILGEVHAVGKDRALIVALGAAVATFFLAFFTRASATLAVVGRGGRCHGEKNKAS